MSKTTGFGDNFYVDGYNLSGDTNSLGRIGGGPALMEMHGIDASAVERMGGLRDGAVEWVSYFNPGVDAAHDALSILPTASVIATYFRGTTIGNPAASLKAKQIGYDPTRGQNGELTIAVSAQASDAIPLEWGEMLTAGIRTDSTETDGASLDGGAETSYGLSLYLHVFSVTGTSVTVTVEESSDDGSGDAFAAVTGGAFAAVTPAAAPQAQRLVTAVDQTVERYLRVATTGTFSDAQFAVMAVRHTMTRDYA